MIARKTILMLGSKVFMSLMGYLSWYFVANHIFQEYVGSIGFALAFIGIMGFFADLGYTTAHIKKVSEGKDLGRCVGTYMTVKIMLLSFTVILIIISVWFYQTIYPKHGFDSVYDEPVIFILLFWYILSNLSQIPLNTFIGKQYVAKAELGLVVSTTIQSILTIILVIHYNNVYLLAMTYVVGALFLCIISFYLLRGIPIKRPSFPLFLEYTKFGLPLMLTVTAAPLIAFIDKIMIKFFWVNADVAIYWNAQKFAQLPDDLTAVVTSILFPTFSSLIAIGSIDKVRQMTRISERYMSMFIIPSTFILAALSKPFIIIFSDISYTTSSMVFFFLMGWVAVRALMRPYIAHFVSFGKTTYPLILTFIYIPLNVVLNLIFIPESILGVRLFGLGPVGAAIATLVSAIINYLIVRFLSYKLVSIGINISVIKHIVAGGIIGCLVYLIQEQVHQISRFYELAGIALISGLTFIGLLYLMHDLTRKDMEFLFSTLDPRKMKDYILKEIMNR